ncbi:acyl-CoA dehydrogenase family protein [Stieleria marina]|uniref:Acyl-CoA dehydrogenase n=1 Tax=Stieleria marina TaxID=1930275 RepID=A0A517NZK7_9BACT|nr:Acyl-CoA dehydrogenase [Planctomycetes bacterium K23_9]
MSLDFDTNHSPDVPKMDTPVVPVTDKETAAPKSASTPEPSSPQASTPVHHGAEEESFAEVALRLGGASDDEAKRTGVVDTADDQVEALFAPQYKTVNSPVHRAVWDSKVPTELFYSDVPFGSPAVESVVNKSLAIVQRHRDVGTLVDEHGKISNVVMTELGEAGYWGLLVDTQYGGAGATMREFGRMITRMATIDPTVAGLASVHGCIGAVDPVRSFGTDEQKRRFLPKLGDGRALSAFALTEPGAGSDLTALKTTAVLDGDHYVVNGEKLFITNAIPGRTIGLVCKIDDVPSVLIVDLPDQENEHFYLNRYGIYALRRAHNNGLVFKDFRVPAANLLVPARGDGLTIAYHGLNLGRVSLCANAAGAMRWMLAEMLPWAEYRKTYGLSITKRELVRRRVGKMAGLIVACDALTQWCSGLIDQGYRGEMECIVAKIFGSESQKEAAIELFMKTHGGRSFLEGHLFGDNVHEFLAPCIYEGEGEMLGMAFFKSLVKDHGKRFFEPIGRTLHGLGIKQPNLANPMHLWALKGPMMAYTRWFAGRKLAGSKWSPIDGIDHELGQHTKFAQRLLSKSGFKISGTMRHHQLKLADRQCRMSALSSELQGAIVMLVTSLYAAHSADATTKSAASVMCGELRRQITGKKPSDKDFRLVTTLGGKIADEGWAELKGVQSGKILQSYK